MTSRKVHIFPMIPECIAVAFAAEPQECIETHGHAHSGETSSAPSAAMSSTPCTPGVKVVLSANASQTSTPCTSGVKVVLSADASQKVNRDTFMRTNSNCASSSTPLRPPSTATQASKSAARHGGREMVDGKAHGQGTHTGADGSLSPSVALPHVSAMASRPDSTSTGEKTYANGSTYRGDMVDDKRHGQGTYTWADGRRYEGGWRDDKRHGQGTATLPDWRRYEGGWRDGKQHGGAAVAAGGGSSSAMVASGGGGAGTPETVPSGSKRKNTDLWPEPKAARIGGAGGSGGVGEDIDNRAPSAGGGGGGGFGGFQVQSGKGTGTGASQGPGGEVAMAGHDAVKSDQDGQTEYDDTESDDEIEAEVQRTDRMSSEDDGSKRRRVTGEPEVAGSEVATSVASASEVAGSEVPSGSAVTPQPKVDARRNVELSCALAGHEYSRAGNHRMALHMFNTCKVVATEMGDNSALLKAEYNIGSTMGASGDFDNAILAFGRMKKIGHELNNMRAVTIASSRLGLCYKKKKDYAKAISCFKEEKSVLGSEFDKVKADLNIGVCHFDMKKFGDALPFLEKYMVVAEEGDWPDRYNAYPTIGECFFHMKQYDKAIETLQKFLMFAETCGVVIEKEKMLMVWQILGDSYYDLKQYDDAIIFIEKLKSARIEMGKTNLVLQICEKLATCYKATQNYEKAMDQLTFVIEEQKKEAMCT